MGGFPYTSSENAQAKEGSDPETNMGPNCPTRVCLKIGDPGRMWFFSLFPCKTFPNRTQYPPKKPDKCGSPFVHLQNWPKKGTSIKQRQTHKGSHKDSDRSAGGGARGGLQRMEPSRGAPDIRSGGGGRFSFGCVFL